MSNHRHLSKEEIFERVSEGREADSTFDCGLCEAETASQARFFAELKRVDTDLVATTEWDDLLLRRRIREAVALEASHSRSFLGRFAILRPALASVLVAVVALAVWSPFAGRAGRTDSVALLEASSPKRLPAWRPLPDESEDEGFAVLAEWTPNDDELAIARCRAACLSGLSSHEEEDLFRAVSLMAPRSPSAEASPL